MPDYRYTKIYRIDVGVGCYIGHTTVSLKERRAGHVSDFKRSNRKVYTTMRSLGWSASDIKLILVEDYPCANKFEAEERESWWISQLGTLNMTNHNLPIPTRVLVGPVTCPPPARVFVGPRPSPPPSAKVIEAVLNFWQ